MVNIDIAMSILDMLLQVYLLIGLCTAIVTLIVMFLSSAKYEIHPLVYIWGFFKVTFTWPVVLSDFLAYRRIRRKWNSLDAILGEDEENEEEG